MSENSPVPAPTDRVQEPSTLALLDHLIAMSAEVVDNKHSGYNDGGTAFSQREAAKRALLARVRSLEADAERYRAALDSIAHPIAALQTEAMKSGKVVKGALAVALQNDPGYLRHLAERALAAHPLEAPASGQ